MINQLIRIALILFSCLIFQSLFNYSDYFDISERIQYPIIVTLTPYILSKYLPLLGIDDILKSKFSLYSTIFLFFATIVVQAVVSEMAKSKQNDVITNTLKDEETKFLVFNFKTNFILILSIVLFLELVFSRILESNAQKNENNHLEKIILKALSKHNSMKSSKQN